MRCYLVRHAQTDWNQGRRFQGRSNPPLGSEGLEQAQSLGEYFAGRAFGPIYSSTLKRSVQTAEIIAGKTGSMLEMDPGLSEIGFGVWEGLTVEEVRARFDGMYQQWCQKPSQVAIPKGEPCDEFRARVRRSFQEVARRHQGGGFQELVVVSHGGVICSLLADWLGSDYDRLSRSLVLGNGSVSIIEWSVDSTFVVCINAAVRPAVLSPRAVG